MDLPLYKKYLGRVKQEYLTLIVFALLIAAFYGNTLWNGFIFDDYNLIVKNEYIHSLKYLPKTFTSCLWEFVDGACKENIAHQIPKPLYPYYRPVGALTLMILYQISSSPWLFHLFDISAFLAVAFLLFIFAKLLTKKFLIAFLTALFFIIHPINSEVVNWTASAIFDEIAAIFIILTLIAHFKYREARSRKNPLPVYLLYFLALLSKEAAIILPLLLLSLDLLFFKIKIKKLLEKQELQKYLLFLIPLSIYTFLKISVFGLAFGGKSGYFNFLEGIHARITLFAQYIAKMFYPYPLSHAYPFEKNSDFLNINFLASLVVAAGFFIALFFFFRVSRSRQRLSAKGGKSRDAVLRGEIARFLAQGNNIFAFSLIWFILLISLVIIFLVGEPASMFSDRFLFLPGIGFALLFGYVFYYALSRSKITRYIAIPLILLIVAVSWSIVYPRNKNWKDAESMHTQTIKDFPDVHEARRTLAEMYLMKGELEKAKAEFEEILKRKPDWEDITMVYNGLGDYYKAKNDPDRAMEFYQKSVESAYVTNRDYVAFYDLGMAYAERENYLRGLVYLCVASRLYPPSEQVADGFNSVISEIQSKYIQNNALYQNVLKEFSKSPEEKIVFQDKQCDEKSCQYLFSLEPMEGEIILPFLISAETSAGNAVSIKNSSFNPQTSEIMLETDQKFKDEKINFIFPTCEGKYYEAATS